MITSQNHGFSVDESTLPANARVTHRSLFDGSNQGFELTDAPAFSFQGHPEASPGPHDVAPLFDRFIESMRAGAHLCRASVCRATASRNQACARIQKGRQIGRASCRERVCLYV